MPVFCQHSNSLHLLFISKEKHHLGKEDAPLEGPVTLCQMTSDHFQIAGNTISEVLAFKIFLGEHAPGTPPVGSHHVSCLQRKTRRDQYFLLATPLLLINQQIT